MINKRGQLTVFIVVAIIIVASVALFFVFRETLTLQKLPSNIEPVYNNFLSCIEENTLAGISVLGSQGGYIYLPEFEPGSRYMPFSSQFDFLGNPIPYWYYVSGNNIPREQIPSKADMQNQLERFIEEEISDCDFVPFYDQGFAISQDGANAKVTIRDNVVEVNLNSDLTISSEDGSYFINNHDISVSSNLGNLYDNARRIYEQEQETLFLEDYAIDILRLYAPVDGVELTCSPKTWSADEVFNDLEQAIEANTLSLKVKGGDYVLDEEDDEYFVIDLPTSKGVNVKFLNSRNWPRSFEVNPSNGNFLIAEPVGNQPGLGALGFCYVAYHFVYDVKYPILVQVSEDDELFQFPLAIILQGNNPREPLVGSAESVPDIGVCENKNTMIQVDVLDSNLNPIEADVSYECVGEVCEIGKSPLREEFPQCVNGNIIARADGFVESRFLFSVIEEASAQIILDRLHTLEVKLNLDQVGYNGNAIIYFASDKDSKTVVYPDQRLVELREGEYELQLYIYSDSSLQTEAITLEQCVDVPKGGLLGIFGVKEERCFDVAVPEQIVSSALVGGGKLTIFISESQLETSKVIEINAPGLSVPETLDELQDNYIAFENSELDVNFK